MAYSLNGTDLSTFGIIAGHSDDSNIALSGHLDFPKRLGKSFHSWNDEDGIEPYVSESEIRFEGRDIKFNGYIKGINKYDLLEKQESLLDFLRSLTDLATLSTPWGDFEVYRKGSIDAQYFKNQYIKIEINFRQPDTGITSVESGGISNGIDGIDFSYFGFKYMKLDGQFGSPNTKGENAISYNIESYQVAKVDARRLNLKGLFISSSYEELQTKVSLLNQCLSKPGLRTLQINTEPYRQFFVNEGFEISKIIKGNRVSAFLDLKMTEVGKPIFNPEFLTDEFGNFILEGGQKIVILT